MCIFVLFFFVILIFVFLITLFFLFLLLYRRVLLYLIWLYLRLLFFFILIFKIFLNFCAINLRVLCLEVSLVVDDTISIFNYLLTFYERNWLPYRESLIFINWMRVIVLLFFILWTFFQAQQHCLSQTFSENGRYHCFQCLNWIDWE